MTIFGERLKQALQDQERTMAWLCRKVDLTYPHGLKYFAEDVDCYPRLDTAIHIADALGVSLDYLSGRG